MKTQHIHHMALFTGIALVFLGITVRMLISRRRFNRRGIGGLQQFSTYGQWLFTIRIEQLFNAVALIIILSGLFLTACGWYANH